MLDRTLRVSRKSLVIAMAFALPMVAVAQSAKEQALKDQLIESLRQDIQEQRAAKSPSDEKVRMLANALEQLINPRGPAQPMSGVSSTVLSTGSKRSGDIAMAWAKQQQQDKKLAAEQ